MTAPTEEPRPQTHPAALMFQIISGFWISRAVCIIAQLGLPDLLKTGPQKADELATKTGTDTPSLFRVLRALASVGVLEQDSEGRFANTPVSETLITDTPGTLRWFTISELGQEHYPAWGNLMHSVRTGEIAFDNFFGTDVWSYFQAHPEEAALFNDSMSGMTAQANEAITALYDFSPFKKIVDVGGGHGALLTAILNSNSNATGIIFDSAQVIPGAKLRIESNGLSHRCETVSGDFFEAVPPGGDAYLLKWIIHDWDDEKSIRILKNIRKEIPLNGKLILVDCVVPDTTEPHFSKFIDLNMLVMTGGKERTEKEFADLFAKSGFKLARVIPTESPTAIVEAEPL